MIPCPRLGEADPGGLRALPSGNQKFVAFYETIILVIFFQEKKQKAFVLLKKQKR
jgi:hypothetical protein